MISVGLRLAPWLAPLDCGFQRMAEIADRLSGAREVVFALRIGHVPEIAKAANGSIVSIIMSDLSDSGLNAVITE